MTQLSLKRPITDYTKVQTFIGNVIRNKKSFISKRRLQNKKYLDIGCGPNAHENFINLDYQWSPKIDICWDFTKKNLPFDDNYFEGIYTEHCLEHITLNQCEAGMKEFYRVLKVNGILRIVVPDGELYLDSYYRKKNGEDISLPYEEGYISPIARVNGIFREHGHQFIYDFYTFKLLLEKAGFKNIFKVEFGIGKNKELILDTEYRKIESLYIEAYK
ncbi:MAG: methyltransferase domain-containing protein [Ginsengibacter sp.]